MRRQAQKKMDFIHEKHEKEPSEPSPSQGHVGLAPAIASSTRIMILGSFPGAASLAAQQYYAHPRNQFWRLLSVLVGDDLAGLAYAQRLPRLLAHGIGLWDVIAACDRVGSLDSKIRNPIANDLAGLRQQCPLLRRVAFNGQTAGKFAPQFAAAGFQALVLPSSSPANAQMTFEQKLDAWRALLAGQCDDGYE
jgi:hypoxanthine-DNA glycosylase